ncbi:Mucin-associated surface protein (MASP) [Trypanosoma cruzi]|uniref:Mucin-associated surface protein (MASP), putative n=2 Tax=Trypanosoma cruzi TaxID=5693 RepID=Q4DYU3_TRYCC|nr:mucin-associated surface protein (MASP), putative [Trypanosoma cruzi]EAN97704.1 mucin-associated surface protein (MASP), putative [Trypanosoma cruzi]KAF5214742.1 Mucin-associated surface protein (MASP) subgroup S105 [Trypanosoma cruzi]PWV19910.1 Mucin-associated surface protein (MASP) [Trypanosoma cruzi]|eukprot:XP_819555.1 mucin-associated surface protein (MASP) [Trypanosoma cruzi strain CL Brener]
MAMMMTGRVLLVCALCVLWCGAGGGFAKEAEASANGVSSKTTPADRIILNWHVLMKEECATENTKNGTVNVPAMKRCIQVAMKGICDTFYNKTPSEIHDPEVKGMCTYYAAIPDEPDEPPTPQGPPPDSAVSNTTSNEGTPKNAPESDDAGRGEGKEDEKEHGNTKQKAVESAAMKHITKTADSDGRTAVTHITFPLLLLLLVAAAAALVAA